MRIRWHHLKKATVYLAGLVVAVALVAPVGQFFISLADERGWYQHPNAKVAGMIAWFAAVAANSWFHWLGGSIIGFAAGAWLDTVLSKPRDQRGADGSTAAPSITKTSEIVPASTPTLLRLQFHGGQRAPTEMRRENVLSWYVVWSGEANFSWIDEDGRKKEAFKIPKTWVIFVLFDMPINFKQLVVQPGMPNFPRFEVKHSAPAYVVITTYGEDIPAGMLDIYSTH